MKQTLSRPWLLPLDWLRFLWKKFLTFGKEDSARGRLSRLGTSCSWSWRASWAPCGGSQLCSGPAQTWCFTNEQYSLSLPGNPRNEGPAPMSQWCPVKPSDLNGGYLWHPRPWQAPRLAKELLGWIRSPWEVGCGCAKAGVWQLWWTPDLLNTGWS